jgi:hypothetical protein
MWWWKIIVNPAMAASHNGASYNAVFRNSADGPIGNIIILKLFF